MQICFMGWFHFSCQGPSIKDVRKIWPFFTLSRLPPVSAYFGLLQAKINSSVRIWQTPLPPWCGRPLWMTPYYHCFFMTWLIKRLSHIVHPSLTKPNLWLIYTILKILTGMHMKVEDMNLITLLDLIFTFPMTGWTWLLRVDCKFFRVYEIIYHIDVLLEMWMLLIYLIIFV